MKRWALIATCVAALTGLAVSVVSTSQHLRIWREGLETASFCAISEKINCDIVNASSYSKILGVPVSSFAFAFYLVICGMALFALLSQKNRRSTAAFAWFVSIGGLVCAAYFAYISTAILGVVCIECLIMYAMNLIVFILLFSSIDVHLRSVTGFVRNYILASVGRIANPEFSPKVVHHAAVLLAVFAACWFGMKAIEAKGKGPSDTVTTDEKSKAFYMQSLYSIEPDPAWPVWGNPSAKVTLVEYSEFQCPFCKMAAFNLKPYLQEFKKHIRLYFVNYPLDQACNSEMEHPMHQWACMAGKAGICANKLGSFWEFHDDLFREQQKLNEETILSIAEKHGWARGEFRACIDSPETDAQIKKDIASSKKIYVTGTPTIFLNNKKLRYWRDPDFLQRVVKEEIKRAK